MIPKPCQRSYDRLMRVSRVAFAVLLTTLLVAAPAEAGKTKTYAPPGKAGTSEYAEVVPTPGGNARTPAMGGGNKTGAQISRIGSASRGIRKLEKLGKQGAAAAQFAQETAPTIVRSRHGFGGQPGATGSTTLTAAAGGSALSGIGHLLGGSDAGGIGLFLPLLLAFGLGAALALLIVRLRRSREPGAPGV
jgi:hypothetical protein